MTLHDRVALRLTPDASTAARTTVDTAVILAAGAGSRLRLDGRAAPKPLYSLFGRTLIERAILRSHAAGVSRFVVIVGHQAELIRPVLFDLAGRIDVTIEVVYNPRWREGNGLSALAGAPYLAADQPFFLMMCDHVFSHSFLDRLVEEDVGHACAVVVDRDVAAVNDLDEATKVAIEGSGVTRIGKGIVPFDGVDTGVFLCRPPLFEALREAQAAGEDTLSAGMQRLAERGQVCCVCSEGRFWQDIDTPEDLARAQAGLARHPVFETDRYADLAGG